MKEKIVIIFIALIVGLLITTVGFFFYQSTSAKPDPEEDIKPQESITPVFTEENSKLFVTVDEPKNESVTNRRTIQVRGKSNPENTIVVSSNSEDKAGSPSNDGSFSFTIDIEASINTLTVRAIAPNGDWVQDKRIITFSSEEF